ncbi:MAG: hypothetical protein GX414_13825 [Acidobacteria bacterium]|nr:hypothetical protein [Acidobacteriota bacterium]
MGIGFLGLLQLAIVLVLTCITLGVAISFAVKPSESKLTVLRPLSLGLAFGAVGMFCAGSANTLAFASNAGLADARNVQMLLGGFAEALLPGAVAFSALAVAWALAAVGFHRMK